MCSKFDELSDEKKLEFIFDCISRGVPIPAGLHTFMRRVGLEELIDASSDEDRDS